MNDRADDIHEWDAAYVLGSLSATDRAQFEAHLAGCDACTRSLADLAGLPGVLRMLPVEDALALLDEPDPAAEAPGAAAPTAAAAGSTAAGPAPVVPLPSTAASASHRVPRGRGLGGGRRLTGSASRPARLSRRAGGWLLAAAAVVLLVGGAGLGSALRAGVSAPVADPTPAASSPAGDLDDAGSRTVVATWGAGQTESRLLAATSSLPMDQIRSVQITPSDSDVVLASRDL